MADLEKPPADAPAERRAVAWWEWPIVVLVWPLVTGWDLLRACAQSVARAVVRVLAYPARWAWAGLKRLTAVAGRVMDRVLDALAAPARRVAAQLRRIWPAVAAALRGPARVLDRALELLLRGLATVLRHPFKLLGRALFHGLKGLFEALEWLAYPVGHLITAARRATRQLLRPVRWIGRQLAGPVRWVREQSARMRARVAAVLAPARARARTLGERVRATLVRR